MYCSKECSINAEKEKTLERVRRYRKRYDNRGDNYWGLGSGTLGSHKHEDIESEFHAVKKELKRLKIKK